MTLDRFICKIQYSGFGMRRVVSKPHTTTIWWKSGAEALALETIDSYRVTTGWKRRKDLEPLRDSRIWVHAGRLQTVAFCDGELAIETHSHEGRFREVLDDWADLKKSSKASILLVEQQQEQEPCVIPKQSA